MVYLFSDDVRKPIFIKLLRAAPGDKDQKQSFFLAEYGTLIAKTNYETMWSRLVEHLGGRSEAGEAIFEYVLYSSSPRLRELLSIAINNEAVDIYADDLEIVHILFFKNGSLRSIGELFINYILNTKRDNQSQSEKEIKPLHFKDRYDHEVVLSYASEQRTYVGRVASSLNSLGVDFYYDRFSDAQDWGEDLNERIIDVYQNKGQYCVMFISKDYARKVYPQKETKAALTRAVKQKGRYILPVRFDDTQIPGLLPSIKYLNNYDYTPSELASLIYQVVRGEKNEVAYEKISDTQYNNITCKNCGSYQASYIYYPPGPPICPDCRKPMI